jgi:peptidoglycan/xylan/chitin deacetylase (PgdA/CDA1 family)
MRTRNARGTGYIVTDLVGGTTDYVTWTQLQTMYAAGWTIGNHTKAHIDLTTQSLADQQAALLAARTALNAHGMTNVDYVAYPNGNYNADTLTAMANLSMRTGRTINKSNLVSPLMQPYEITQQSIQRSTTLTTAKSWIDTARSRQEIVVLTLHDISSSPYTYGWYTDRFQSLVDYCIQQGVVILTMDDLYRLQSSDITIPGAR